MANVNIKFNNKEFLLSCEDGQEEHLEELSVHLNEKFNDLKLADYLMKSRLKKFTLKYDKILKQYKTKTDYYQERLSW